MHNLSGHLLKGLWLSLPCTITLLNSANLIQVYMTSRIYPITFYGTGFLYSDRLAIHITHLSPWPLIFMSQSVHVFALIVNNILFGHSSAIPYFISVQVC